MNKIGTDYFPQILEMKRADTLAQSDYQREEKLDTLAKLDTLYHQILEANQCVSLKTLEITGNDLINIGVPKGKAIGEILHKLLDDVIDHPEHNTHEQLIEMAKNIL
jgi:tRNA nucleotidyltransferase (CCA-adding enzyme)